MQGRWLSLLFDELARCKPWLEATIKRTSQGTVNFDDVAAMVLGGRYRLWVMSDACWITEMIDTPRKRVLNVPYLGGNMETIKKNLRRVEDYARANRCSMITGQGRRGWVRALGFEEVSTSFVRDV